MEGLFSYLPRDQDECVCTRKHCILSVKADTHSARTEKFVRFLEVTRTKFVLAKMRSSSAELSIVWSGGRRYVVGDVFDHSV